MAHATLANAVLEPSQEQRKLFWNAISKYTPADPEHITLIDLFEVYNRLKTLRSLFKNPQQKQKCNLLANQVTAYTLLTRESQDLDLYFELRSSDPEHDSQLANLFKTMREVQIKEWIVDGLNSGVNNSISKTTISIRKDSGLYMCIPCTVLTPDFAKELLLESSVFRPNFAHLPGSKTVHNTAMPIDVTALSLYERAFAESIGPLVRNVLRPRVK